MAVYIPRGGFSQLDVPGGPFHDPAATDAFIAALQANLRPGIPVVQIETHINDPAFSGRVANALLEMLNQGREAGETDHSHPA